MKKKGIYLSMATMTLLSMAGGTFVHAADVGNASTNGSVTLQAPGATGGDLTLDTTKLPQSIDFGNNNIEYGATGTNDFQGTPMDGQATKNDSARHVTDNRGKATGWTLKVSQNKQFETAKKAKLEGTLLTVTPDTKNIITIGDTDATKVTGAEVTFQDPDKLGGDTQEILGAKNGSGDGITDSALKSFKISVPKKSVKVANEAYGTQLTWTLSDTPQP